MKRIFVQGIVAVFVFLSVVGTGACWLYRDERQRQPDIVSISRFDFVFSERLNSATSMADLPALRKVNLDGDDIEVRVWRLHNLQTPEGVFLKRIDGDWSGIHLRSRANERENIQAAEVKQLNPRDSDWTFFWGKLVEKGILLLPLTPENECDTRYIDGIRYVVEINQSDTYRNYQYSENVFDCRESRQMSEIGEIIGQEFDLGPQECKTSHEWFACTQ